MTNPETEALLRKYLIRNGYKLSNPHTTNGATGVDIEAQWKKTKIAIEVIGYSSHPSKRSRDFFEGFFRAISRIQLGHNITVLACPLDYRMGLTLRLNAYGLAWSRLGNAFRELELWFVYPGGEIVDFAAWNYWYDQYSKDRPMEILNPYRCPAARELHLPMNNIRRLKGTPLLSKRD